MRLSGNTDCHTSDIGHWFAMTETNFVYSLKRRTDRPCVFLLYNREAPVDVQDLARDVFGFHKIAHRA